MRQKFLRRVEPLLVHLTRSSECAKWMAGAMVPAVFAVFCRRLSAHDIPFSAEILGFGRCGEQQNSGTARCFAAVIRGFRNSGARIPRAAAAPDRGWSKAMICM